MPHSKISDDLADALGEIAVSAARRRDSNPIQRDDEAADFLRATAGLTVDNAINRYLNQVAYEVPLPEFRKAVGPKGKLASAITALRDLLPKYSAGETDEGVIPLDQMRALFCYGQQDSDGLDADDFKKENMWAHQLGPAAMVAHLGTWLELLGRLYKNAGKGPPPIAAKRDFVRELGGWWREIVKDDAAATIGSSRAEKFDGGWDGERGLFASFVKKAVEGIPGGGDLSWDQAIRDISEEKA
jgi:hypothetical protein